MVVRWRMEEILCAIQLLHGYVRRRATNAIWNWFVVKL